MAEEAERLQTTELIAHIDGASRGNPGPAAYAAVIEAPDGRRLATIAEAIGPATNNIAEYRGLIAALEYAVAQGALRLRVLTDSELLAKQVKGIYRIKSPHLRPLHEHAMRLVAQLRSFSIEHVRREKNREADRMANMALDKTKPSVT